jgi:hypothetical protein
MLETAFRRLELVRLVALEFSLLSLVSSLPLSFLLFLLSFLLFFLPFS